MKKSDLKNGMVVEMRDEGNYLVVGDKFLKYDGFMRISDYNDDMRFGNKDSYGFDIMKVYAEVMDLKELDDDTKRLIWERRPHLTNDEIAILRNIDKKYKWIARDGDGGLCIYKDQPVKQGNPAWGCRTSYADLSFFSNMFNFIQWTDSEPYVIVGLLYSRKR